MGNLAVHTDWHRVASYHNFRVDGRSHCLRPAPATLSAPARNLYSRHHLARTLEYHCNPIYIFKSCKTSRSDGSFEHNPANHDDCHERPCRWIVYDFAVSQSSNGKDAYASVGRASESIQRHRSIPVLKTLGSGEI